MQDRRLRWGPSLEPTGEYPAPSRQRLEPIATFLDPEGMPFVVVRSATASEPWPWCVAAADWEKYVPIGEEAA